MGRGGWIGAVVLVAVAGLTAADSDLEGERRLAVFGESAMARADTWYQQSLLYSQDQCYRMEVGYAATDWSGGLGGCHLPYYRTDCSGFVSMAWNLPHSYATPRPGAGQDLGDLTTNIEKDQLSTGDALVAPGKHVRLFETWTDNTKTRYLAYDFGSTPVKHQEYVWGASGDHVYTPVRYFRVELCPQPLAGVPRQKFGAFIRRIQVSAGTSRKVADFLARDSRRQCAKIFQLARQCPVQGADAAG